MMLVKRLNILARLKNSWRYRKRVILDTPQYGRHEVHVVKIFDKRVECSCGDYAQDCDFGAEAKHLGYLHAQMNLHSRVENKQSEYPDGFPEI